MYASRYFADRFFPLRYFPQGTDTAAPAAIALELCEFTLSVIKLRLMTAPVQKLRLDTLAVRQRLELTVKR